MAERGHVVVGRGHMEYPGHVVVGRGHVWEDPGHMASNLNPLKLIITELSTMY